MALWRDVILGAFLAQAHGTSVYGKVVDVAKVTGVHSAEVISLL